MSEKLIKARIQNKFAPQEDWDKAIQKNFIPLAGEIIAVDTNLYEDDGVTVKEAKSPTIYIGDGKTPLGDLKPIGGYIDLIKMTDDLVFTEPFGKFGSSDQDTKDALNDCGRYTISTLRTGSDTERITLAELLNQAFASDTMPAITQPSITFTGTSLGAYEVGTNVSVGYKFTNETAGSYSYGPETGVTWKNYEATFDNKTKTGKNGTFDTVTVTDGMSLTLTGKATHTSGTIPKTALENNYNAGKILETTKDFSYSTKLTGYRKMFMGTMSTKPNTMTSSHIRELENCVTAAQGTKTDWALTTNATTTKYRVVIAVPSNSNRKLTKVLDVNDSNANITGSFSGPVTVKVEGANGYTSVDYKVYYMDAANPLNANTYKVSIS